MKIGVVREIAPGEARVALTPGLVAELCQDHHEIVIEHDAGRAATFTDDSYRAAGATVLDQTTEIYARADALLKVRPPEWIAADGGFEMNMMRAETVWISLLAPFTHGEQIAQLARQGITAYAMEFVPRIARAQSMDALTAMASLAGYKAVLLAAERLGKVIPLMMTAAGTLAPANVLILGAGVAGLQAIATAKRLGARVTAFDPRASVREQIQSVGATFIAMDVPTDVETATGYAGEQTAAFLQRERDTLVPHLERANIVITTAQIFGKRAPLLITAAMVERMRAGSVLVDLAAEQGGNCELTIPDQVIAHNGVQILGPTNLPGLLPVDASQLYGRTIVNLFCHLYPVKGEQPDSDDPIARATRVTHGGAIVHPDLILHQPEGASI